MSPPDLPDPMQAASVLVGGKIVIAWTTATSEVVATTFSSTPRERVSGATSVPIVDGGADGDPVLLTARGFGASVGFPRVESGDPSDPLNGIEVVSRSSDGSWTMPRVIPTGATSSCGRIAGLLLSDRSTLFAFNAANCQAVTLLHGSAFIGNADTLMGGPANEAYEMALARDGRGHVWSAWYAPLRGVAMRELDSTTGRPIGGAFVAPDSIPPESIWEGPSVDHFALVCNPATAGCRVVYEAHLRSRIVSWTPHDGGRQILVAADAGISLGAFGAAYRSDGRLWLAWIVNPNLNRQSLHFTLVGPAGRRAAVYRVPTPHDSVPTHLALQPLRGGLLVFASVPTTRSAELGASRQQLWADHVTNR